MIEVQVRFCPSGEPTTDRDRSFSRVPVRGELIRDHLDDLFAVVDVEWQWDGNALVIAHSLDRPRARAVLAAHEPHTGASDV